MFLVDSTARWRTSPTDQVGSNPFRRCSHTARRVSEDETSMTFRLGLNTGGVTSLHDQRPY